jgi:peptide/nickel transport system permease protein
MIPVLIGVTIIVFTLLYMSPGNPAAIILGQEATPEKVAALEKEMGLDRPYIVRLVDYIGDVAFRFDLGNSYRTRAPVRDEVFKRLGITVKLTLISMTIGTILGIAMGIISAIKQYTWIDRITTIVALFGISTPSFWLALLMILLFAVKWRIFPVSGSYGPKYWVLPCATLGIQAAGIIMRMTRSSMLDVIRSDYIRTARAKGQTEWSVIMKHALRNALIPIITVIGNQTGVLIGGSILVESIFSFPGLGKYMLDAINNRDYPAVQGTVLIISFMSVLIMLLVDIAYSFADPRIKAVYSAGKRKVIKDESHKA